MKAIVYTKYGSPDVLELRDIDRPEIGDDEVLVLSLPTCYPEGGSSRVASACLIAP
jgi:hypothetical protein